MVESETIAFIKENLGSVYALELLILIKGHAHRSWRANDLIRELRSSATAVSEALNRLIQAGFVSEHPAGRYAFEPRSPTHAQLAAAVADLYDSTPISVMRAIVQTPASG